jgi:hypothetical protein
VAALIGIGPKDEFEGMNSAQILASHNVAMVSYRRAMAMSYRSKGDERT